MAIRLAQNGIPVSLVNAADVDGIMLYSAFGEYGLTLGRHIAAEEDYCIRSVGLTFGPAMGRNANGTLKNRDHLLRRCQLLVGEGPSVVPGAHEPFAAAAAGPDERPGRAGRARGAIRRLGPPNISNVTTEVFTYATSRPSQYPLGYVPCHKSGCQNAIEDINPNVEYPTEPKYRPYRFCRSCREAYDKEKGRRIRPLLAPTAEMQRMGFPGAARESGIRERLGGEWAAPIGGASRVSHSGLGARMAPGFGAPATAPAAAAPIAASPRPRSRSPRGRRAIAGARLSRALAAAPGVRDPFATFMASELGQAMYPAGNVACRTEGCSNFVTELNPEVFADAERKINLPYRFCKSCRQAFERGRTAGSGAAPAARAGSPARGARGGRGPGAAVDAAREAEQTKCVVCLENNTTRALLPCGHKCCCENCYASFVGGKCPMCRKDVTQAVRIFG